METKVPVIDLQEIHGASQKLREACEKWGCFRLLNHGVPKNLIADMKAVAKDLFDRPVEIKRRNKDVLPGSGYMASPTETNPLYEALGVFDLSSSSCLSSFLSDLEASPHEREIIEMYTRAISKLAINIAGTIGTSMGLEDYSFAGWHCQLRMNKYIFTKETIGCSSIPVHTDSAFLTVLQDDENIGGLDVMDHSGEFVVVDPCPGTFLVNLGDIAVPWSNGKLYNVKHRVQCKDVGLRLSMATFFAPAADKIIEAPPKFIDCHPPLYVPFTYGEYRNIRASKKSYSGSETLNLVRQKN